MLGSWWINDYNINGIKLRNQFISCAHRERSVMMRTCMEFEIYY
jgi:hypothetical protein